MKNPFDFSCRSIGFCVAAGFLSNVPAFAQTASESAAAFGADDDTILLSPFEVSAESDHGYMAKDSLSASRVKTAILDIPQSIFVMTEEMLNDQAGLDLSEVLRYVPGASVSGDTSESINIRGFSVAVPLTNGFRAPRTFPTEQGDVQRVEILRGPASVLYGNVFGVGGVVNRITKQPLFTPHSQIKVQFQDQDFTQRVQFDTSGPLGDSKQFAYRLIGAYQDSDYVQDFAEMQRLAIQPKFAWRINPRTKLSVELEYINQKSASYGQGMGSTRDYFLNDEIIEIPREVNPEGGLASGELDKYQGSFSLTNSSLSHWDFRLAGLAAWLDNSSTRIVVNGKIRSDLNVVRGGNNNRPRMQDRGVGNYFIQGDAAGHYTFGDISFKPLFGFDYAIDTDGSVIQRSTESLPNFDFFNPDYSPQLPDTWTPESDNRTYTYSPAVFGLLQVGLFKDRLLVNAGSRLTKFRQKVYDYSLSDNQLVTSFTSDTTTVPRYGVVYKAQENISLYYGYSESYQPFTGSNPDGSLLPPRTGKQNEFGVKWDSKDGLFSVNVSSFDIDEVNRPESDPDNSGYQRPSGAINSQGYDVAAIFNPFKNWEIVTGFTHVSQEITAAADADSVGLKSTNVAPNTFTFWTRYSFSSGPLKGLRIGAGATGTDDIPVRFSDGSTNGLSAPGTTVYDLLLSYMINRSINVQVNVRNVTDERYYNNVNANSLSLGQARTVSLTGSYRF